MFFYVIIVIKTIFFKSYQSKIDNVGILTNYFLILIFLVYVFLRNNNVFPLNDSIDSYINWTILGLIVLCTALSSVRVIYKIISQYVNNTNDSRSPKSKLNVGNKLEINKKIENQTWGMNRRMNKNKKIVK